MLIVSGLLRLDPDDRVRSGGASDRRHGQPGCRDDEALGCRRRPGRRSGPWCGRLRDQRREFPDVTDANGCGGDAVIAIPVGEHDQVAGCVPGDSEELVRPECLRHQDAVSLVVPADPHGVNTRRRTVARQPPTRVSTPARYLVDLVGMGRFELPASCSQSALSRLRHQGKCTSSR